MCLTVHSIFLFLIMSALAYEDLFVNGQGSEEMIELGRTQYQMLRERGNLPQYGTCWKGAVEKVNEGCKQLSEDTQSDIALHITNCFLAMSGHVTYNCELDKKANLRAICINSMTDRAFNTYTEFYTHTQNICWFLRGQIWHETITENTYRVGKQLEESANTQKELLEIQKYSIEVQQRILSHGKLLEGVLEDLYVSSKAHKELLSVLGNTLAHFQVWVVGEISFFEALVFYTLTGFFMFVGTSLRRTNGARLVLLLSLCTNLTMERLLCWFFINEDSFTDSTNGYQSIYSFIWYLRYCFIALNLCYFFYYLWKYKDLSVENYKFLVHIKEQNLKILELVEAINGRVVHTNSEELKLINENTFCRSFLNKKYDFDREDSGNRSFSETSKENYSTTTRKFSRANLALGDLNNSRYNLRSKQNTPDVMH